MRLIQAFRQRITDWRRERRINDWAACCLLETEQGNTKLAMKSWASMKAEIARRSPQQVARMEARRGLRNA